MKQTVDNVPEILFHNAQGFYDLGIHAAFNIDKRPGIEGFQMIAPAAVCVSFAVELFLKGLYLVTTKKPIKGHDLLSLYKALPEVVKAKIEVRYMKHQQNDKDRKDLPAFRMIVKKAKDQTQDPPDGGTPTLEKLLKTHSKNFEKWRYLHEISQLGYSYEMDFRSINCLAKSLAETVNEAPINKRFHLAKVK